MRMSRFSLAAAALAAFACLSAPAEAADLYGRSIKDAPVMVSSPGHCYIRGDLGYSWSQDPSARFTQTDIGGLFLTDSASASIANSWIGGAGLGCGSGSRGIRGELMFDWHGDRDLKGTLAAPLGGTFSSSIKTYTLMFNGYYDLGSIRGFVPYVGAGVGLAHNAMGGVAFTALPNVIEGADRWSLAWSLMTGVGYQITDRMTLDFGYRYLDMGKAQSGVCDSAGACTNPRVRIDDIAAHEFKVGIRYSFGGGEPMMMMK